MRRSPSVRSGIMPEEKTVTAAQPTGDGAASNPLREGLPADRIASPCSAVFFGASGDLFKRMLLPAVYSMRLAGTLPTDFALVGFARSSYDDAGFREYCRQQLELFMPPDGKPQGALWDDFARRISYITADFNDTRHFVDLKNRLAQNDRDFGTSGNHLFYLSTPPPVFPEIIKHLKKAGLERDPEGWTRIVVEKPFGTDLASARTLQRAIEAVFPENEIYRIDHYLGKEPVQDIIALRFANTIFEPIWNRNYVQNVQITSAESLGVEERGGYYDHAGALRDMIQNHVINLLALVAMEAPISSDADDIRNEKYKVLSAIVPPAHGDVSSMSARGQYGAGTIDGRAVPAYRQEADVAPDSNTETFAAAKFFIENWRWAGVPFYLRSGKRLPRKLSEIAVTFKPIPTGSTAIRPTTSNQTCSSSRSSPMKEFRCASKRRFPDRRNTSAASTWTSATAAASACNLLRHTSGSSAMRCRVTKPSSPDGTPWNVRGRS